MAVAAEAARLEQALRAIRPDDQLAVMYIDIDEFKAVNDVLGHAVGDKVLIEMARRASRVIAPPAVLARTGGDEFMALLGAGTAEAALRFVRTESTRPITRRGRRVRSGTTERSLAAHPRIDTER